MLKKKLPKIKNCIDSNEIRQIWGMIEKTNAVFDMLSPLDYFDDENVNHLKQFCSGSIFVHPSLYRDLKLMFP